MNENTTNFDVVERLEGVTQHQISNTWMRLQAVPNGLSGYIFTRLGLVIVDIFIENNVRKSAKLTYAHNGAFYQWRTSSKAWIEDTTMLQEVAEILTKQVEGEAT